MNRDDSSAAISRIPPYLRTIRFKKWAAFRNGRRMAFLLACRLSPSRLATYARHRMIFRSHRELNLQRRVADDVEYLHVVQEPIVILDPGARIQLRVVVYVA